MKVYSSAKGGKEYGAPTVLGTQINREGWQQGNVSVSPDGKTMYFTRALLAAHIQQAGKARGVESGMWKEKAVAELIALLRDDYPTLMSALGALADIS